MKIYWSNTGTLANPLELKSAGILIDWIEPSESGSKIAGWKETQGLTIQKEIIISPNLKNLEAILDFSSQDHRHLTGEAWHVLDGRGKMEIFPEKDLLVNFELEPGDFIFIPANLYHRFFCNPDTHFRFLRLVTDISGWKSIYRKKKELSSIKG